MAHRFEGGEGKGGGLDGYNIIFAIILTVIANATHTIGIGHLTRPAKRAPHGEAWASSSTQPPTTNSNGHYKSGLHLPRSTI